MRERPRWILARLYVRSRVLLWYGEVECTLTGRERNWRRVVVGEYLTSLIHGRSYGHETPLHVIECAKTRACPLHTIIGSIERTRLFA